VEKELVHVLVVALCGAVVGGGSAGADVTGSAVAAIVPGTDEEHTHTLVGNESWKEGTLIKRSPSYVSSLSKNTSRHWWLALNDENGIWRRDASLTITTNGTTIHWDARTGRRSSTTTATWWLASGGSNEGGESERTKEHHV
jgi:hypothetical protein